MDKYGLVGADIGEIMRRKKKDKLKKGTNNTTTVSGKEATMKKVQNEIEKIKPGDKVKLLNKIDDSSDEAIWVEVISKDGDLFTGEVVEKSRTKIDPNSMEIITFRSNQIWSARRILEPPKNVFDREISREYNHEQNTQLLKGKALEKENKIEEAIKLYEENVEKNYTFNHPYKRLAMIYRKQRRIDDEIRVLKKAIWVFENIVYRKRGDWLPKLEEFKFLLEKATVIKNKQK